MIIELKGQDIFEDIAILEEAQKDYDGFEEIGLQYIYAILDEIPVDILEQLAVKYDIASEADGWTLVATEAERRALIKKAIELQNIMGTVESLKQLFDTLGLTATVLEWFNYSGSPFNFKCRVQAQDVMPPMRNIRMLIEKYKNVRSFLEELILVFKPTTRNVYFAGYVQSMPRFSFSTVDDIETASVYYGVTIEINETIGV